MKVPQKVISDMANDCHNKFWRKYRDADLSKDNEDVWNSIIKDVNEIMSKYAQYTYDGYDMDKKSSKKMYISGLAMWYLELLENAALEKENR